MAASENPRPLFPGKGGMAFAELRITKGHALPHWALPSVVYHVCCRLADSIPRETRLAWEEERRIFEKRLAATPPLPEEEVQAFRNRRFARWEKWLDAGHGACLLAKPGVAQCLREVFRRAGTAGCRIHACGIMPNHVHLLVELPDADALTPFLQGWKSASAHAINRLLGRRGTVWQADSYNHIVRSPEEYRNQVRYVLKNDWVAAWSIQPGM